MILDKIICGVLDQGRGCLLVFDEPEADVSFRWSIFSCVFISNLRLFVPIECIRCGYSDAGAGRKGCWVFVCEGLFYFSLCNPYSEKIWGLDCDNYIDYDAPFLLINSSPWRLNNLFGHYPLFSGTKGFRNLRDIVTIIIWHSFGTPVVQKQYDDKSCDVKTNNDLKLGCQLATSSSAPTTSDSIYFSSCLQQHAQKPDEKQYWVEEQTGLQNLQLRHAVRTLLPIFTMVCK
jgi:hypothetical protein